MRKAWIWTPFLLVALAAASYGAYLYLSPEPLPAGVLYGNGHIEGTEVSVSAEVTGRVVESNLVEGEPVEAGAPLVVLDAAELKTQLAEAEAEKAAIAKERARIEVEFGTWRHHLENARTDLERYRTLRERGTVPQARLEEAEDAFEQARGRVAALEANLDQAAAQLEAAARRIEFIRLRLDKTQVHAPISGTVLTKGIEVGELAVPGRVVAVLVDLSDLELTVYIPERDIAKVKLGDPARVRLDAFPERLFGATVKRVDQRAQFTPRDIHMPEERARMVFGVILALANPEGFLKPGMPADAWIRWRPEAPWPERLTVPAR